MEGGAAWRASLLNDWYPGPVTRLATTIVYLNVYVFPLGIWYGFGSTYRVLQWFPAHRANWSS